MADPKPLPGHSMRGEAFDEGPRQAAVLMEGTGKVDFPVSTGKPEAQQFFTQGVGQLHGFWYFEAERSFRQVAALDPECAMAYWGMAMANINNEKRAAEFIKLAVAKKAKASRREQLWIDAFAAYYGSSKNSEEARRTALVRALEDLSYEFPDDLEAKAFMVYQLWDMESSNLVMECPTEAAALAEVREGFKRFGRPDVVYLLLTREDGTGPQTIAQGDALIARALAAPVGSQQE